MIGSQILLLRPHLFLSIVLFLIIGSMVFQEDVVARGVMLVPALIVFFAILVVYTLEYETFARDARTAELKRALSRSAGSMGETPLPENVPRRSYAPRPRLNARRRLVFLR